MKDFYFLDEHYGKTKNAGGKSTIDDKFTIKSMGFKSIYNYSRDNELDAQMGEKNFTYYLEKIYLCLKTIISIRKHKNKVILVQYPNCSPRILDGAFEKFYTNNHIIFHIHDIDSWRGLNPFSRDLKLLNMADVLIVHNQKMKNKLREDGVVHPYMICLDLFDYLTDTEINEKNFEKSVVFAGNLQKSVFLREYIESDKNYNLHLYGLGMSKEDKLPPNVTYHGSFTPEELPAKFTGGFGLIWDGESISTCSGLYGKYMQYNNPHKLSLYIASGLPVIVWKNAAIADFVNKYEIGICISKLQDINGIMGSITKSEYLKLRDNIKPLQKKVLSGSYLKAAINEAMEYYSSDESLS
jgi:hypothetical protein